MFNYLCQHLSKLNQEKHFVRLETDTPMECLSDITNTPSLTNIKVTNLSLTNIDLHSKKQRAEIYANKRQCIMNNWAHSHHKLNKIIETKIPYQCKKILGGNIDDAVNIYKRNETEKNLSYTHDLKEYYKSRFVSHSFIKQSLIDKHYTTNSNSVTVCSTRLNALDPTIRNHTFDIPTPTTEMYLKFSISNGEFHSTYVIVSEFPECTVDCHDIDKSHSSNIDEYLCTSIYLAHSPTYH